MVKIELDWVPVFGNVFLFVCFLLSNFSSVATFGVSFGISTSLGLSFDLGISISLVLSFDLGVSFGTSSFGISLDLSSGFGVSSFGVTLGSVGSFGTSFFGFSSLGVGVSFGISFLAFLLP